MLAIVRVVHGRCVVEAEGHGVLPGAAQRYGQAAARDELVAAFVRASYEFVLARAPRHFRFY